MRTFSIALLLLLNFTFSAQNASDHLWKLSSEKEVKLTGNRQIVPNKCSIFSLSLTDLMLQLASAPSDKAVSVNQSNCIISLPCPNGQTQLFKVVESPIMEDKLAISFPNIKTYSIKGITDPFANGKIDVNEFGFHGMIRSSKGDFFIDPYCLQNTTDYIIYYVSDFQKSNQENYLENDVMNENKFKNRGYAHLNSSVPSAPSSGSNLRTYRLALACTGEYAVAATGSATPTMAQTLSKIVTSINRVDGVYETEVAVRLVLVATETNVIFINSVTDPFIGNNNASTLIGESQTVITTNIGSSNFDVGHTFSTGGGGLAALAVVCDDTQKAKGITGSASPVGDPYDIDYVCHEMGHQFSGDHTFNSITSSCGGGNRNGTTAVEPGSGITIMAYAGICGTNDLASNSIAYFHGISYDEIVNFTTLGAGNACAVTTTTGNQPPIVSGTGSYIVPVSTPFILTGTATDPDADALTYSWEQMDIGAAGNWNSGSKPYFRSYVPSSSSARSFPILSSVLSNSYQTVKGEFLPATTQTLNFRLTARDNKMGGGGVNYATSTVNVNATAGPFQITYPNAPSIGWLMGSQQTITWDVNNTDLAPISVSSVNILISYDSGINFTTFLSNTPNDGTETITVPTFTADISTCRIKIESVGNIFYDINTTDFKIASSDISVHEISGGNTLGLSIYPNPFTEEFNLNIATLYSDSKTEIDITDVLGKTLKTYHHQNISALNESISLSGFDVGVYFIRVRNNGQQTTARVIKQ